MNLELLQKLTEAFGPSGYEETIREILRKEVEPLADEIQVERLGSLVAHRKGTGKKIILVAHLDEIGLMATYVDEKGFVRFTSIGGTQSWMFVGERVRFANGTTGIIYIEDERRDKSALPKISELYIDVGATNREDCLVKVGDPAVFVRPLIQQGSRITGKTLDDRLGCYILIEVMRQLKETPYDLYFVFSTQEEVTSSGASTAAYRIKPDIAIAVDTTGTGDTPKAHPMAVELGKGPAVKVKDYGMIAHPMVRNMLVEAAEKAGIPYQMEILLYGTTDAATMQLVRDGIPSGCLSIPSRYVHTPSEMVELDDVENAIQLLLTMLQE